MSDVPVSIPPSSPLLQYSPQRNGLLQQAWIQDGGGSRCQGAGPYAVELDGQNFSTVTLDWSASGNYKRSVYKAIHSDPDLLACTTTDPLATRFHACERYDRCVACGRKSDRLVVNVVMVEVKTADYEITKATFLNKLGRAACGEGDWPDTIECPIARHSPLPELQDLVKVFNPRSLSPNTLQPPLRGLDYYLLPELFAHCLAGDAIARLTQERDDWFKGKRIPTMPNLLFPTFGSQTIDDTIPGGVESAIGRGRRSHAADHASRLILTPQNLNATLAFLPPDMANGLREALEANGLGGALGISGLGRRGDDEYDTDEEQKVVHRRRRRRPTTRQANILSDMEQGDDQLQNGWSNIDASEAGAQSGQSIQDEWIRVESQATATPVASTQSSGSSQRQSSFLRPARQTHLANGVRVDKDHLRRIINAPCPETDVETEK